MSIVKQLWQLQEIDTALLDGKKQLGEILQAQKIPAALVNLRQGVEVLSQTVNHLENDYAESDEQLQKITAELEKHVTKLYSGNVKNPRELGDLQGKVDSLEKRKATLEDMIMIGFGKMETTQNKLDIQSEGLKEKEAVWSQKVAQLKQEQQKVALQVNAINEQTGKSSSEN